jgi:NAD(P)-dependent dehydrogenase (short-subunit alcohol dehydrogenase family)
MRRVDGKVALISGGARGMGAAHALALVAEGARVIIGDIRDDEGKAVAENLGDSAYFVHLDVTDSEQWDAAVDVAVTRFGRLDALVNNAGIVKMGPLRGGSLADWHDVLDVNLTGAYLGMRAVVEPMIAGPEDLSSTSRRSRDWRAALTCTPTWPRSSACAASPNRRRLNWRHTAFGSTQSTPAWCTPR